MQLERPLVRHVDCDGRSLIAGLTNFRPHSLTSFLFLKVRTSQQSQTKESSIEDAALYGRLELRFHVLLDVSN